MARWPISHCSVERFDYGTVPEGLELLAAGVPCQPFSIGGKHRGHQDERNMFPLTVDVIRRVKPQAILIENVTRSVTRRMTSISLLPMSFLVTCGTSFLQRWPSPDDKNSTYHPSTGDPSMNPIASLGDCSSPTPVL
jgi:site-specific DNA-cytosine methylase